MSWVLRPELAISSSILNHILPRTASFKLSFGGVTSSGEGTVSSSVGEFVDIFIWLLVIGIIVFFGGRAMVSAKSNNANSFRLQNTCCRGATICHLYINFLCDCLCQISLFQKLLKDRHHKIIGKNNLLKNKKAYHMYNVIL